MTLAKKLLTCTAMAAVGLVLGVARPAHAHWPFNNHDEQRAIYASSEYGVPTMVPTARKSHEAYTYSWGVPSSQVHRFEHGPYKNPRRNWVAKLLSAIPISVIGFAENNNAAHDHAGVQLAHGEVAHASNCHGGCGDSCGSKSCNHCPLGGLFGCRRGCHTKCKSTCKSTCEPACKPKHCDKPCKQKCHRCGCPFKGLFKCKHRSCSKGCDTQCKPACKPAPKCEPAPKTCDKPCKSKCRRCGCPFEGLFRCRHRSCSRGCEPHSCSGAAATTQAEPYAAASAVHSPATYVAGDEVATCAHDQNELKPIASAGHHLRLACPKCRRVYRLTQTPNPVSSTDQLGYYYARVPK